MKTELILKWSVSISSLLIIYLLLTSNWGFQTFAGIETDQVGWPFEWGPAIVSGLVILVFNLQNKAHPLASLVLVGSFLIFLIRAKIFGVSGVEELESLGDVGVSMSGGFWVMMVLSILLFFLGSAKKS